MVGVPLGFLGSVVTAYRSCLYWGVHSVVTPLSSAPPHLLDLLCQPVPDGFAPFEKAERKPVPALGKERRQERRHEEQGLMKVRLHMLFCMVPFN